MKKSLWLPLAAGVLLSSGCGSKTEVANNNAPGADTGAKVADTAVAASDPKEVVRQFLDSMRQGNATRLSSLLSSLAREEIKRKQLEIAPLGSPNAVFQVIQAVQDGEGMLVESTWTEPEQAGQPATELEVVWELRKETVGWRICGMAVDPKNGDEVQIVDFEKLEPEQPAQDPQRVASLPNAPAGLPANTGAPVGNQPYNGAGQPNNFAPNNSVPGNYPQGNFPPNLAPSANLPSSGSLPPVGNQGALGGYQPSGMAPATNNGGFNLPPTNLPASNPPGGGLPQPTAQYGAPNQLPPIVPGGFSLPPAGNSSPTDNDPGRVRR